MGKFRNILSSNIPNDRDLRNNDRITYIRRITDVTNVVKIRTRKKNGLATPEERFFCGDYILDDKSLGVVRRRRHRIALYGVLCASPTFMMELSYYISIYKRYHEIMWFFLCV